MAGVTCRLRIFPLSAAYPGHTDEERAVALAEMYARTPGALTKAVPRAAIGLSQASLNKERRA